MLKNGLKMFVLGCIVVGFLLLFGEKLLMMTGG